MKRAIAAAVVGAIVLAGCDAGDVAKNVSGLHAVSFKTIYAPKRYCDEVKDAVPDPNKQEDVAYRVVCLKDRQWGRNLLKACRQNPRSVREQYWVYNPREDHAGYVTCSDLKRINAL